MEQSGTLSSQNLGNWVDENILSSSRVLDQKLEVFNSTIKKYTTELEFVENDIDIIQNSKTGVNQQKDLPKLEFPNIDSIFDIANKNTYSKKVQSWKGVVSEVKENSFVARLEDLTNGGTDEMGEFDISEVTPDDLKLLKRGGIFYWSVGLYMEYGQSERKSSLRFQRLVHLDMEELDAIADNVKMKYENLKFRTIDYKPSK